MNRNKAFTIIELIATITVLGIILAIAVPAILNLIQPSTVSAFKSDARIVLRTALFKHSRSVGFDITSLNAGNLPELLSIESENFKTVSIEVYNSKIGFSSVAIRIEGQNRWEGYYACGTYGNMRVTQEEAKCTGDLFPPELTLLGDDPMNIFLNEPYIDPGVTAIDAVDGNITASVIIESSVNVNIPGTYTVIYTSVDSNDNAATIKRIVNVIDNVKPDITFAPNGSDTYAQNHSTIISVSDDSDLDSSSFKYVWTTSNVMPDKAIFVDAYTDKDSIPTPVDVTGGYYLWATAKDVLGNEQYMVSDVFNIDNTKPVITLIGDSSVTTNKGSIYSDEGATATDNADTNVTVISSGTININLVGAYTITYNATDSSGNTAIPVTRTVNVVDVLAPVITMLGSNPITLESGSVYSDAGATALDDADGDVTDRIVTTGNVNPNVLGTYTITYTVSDITGNVAYATRTINVVDTTAPTITVATAGTMLYADPTFASSINGTNVYNNLGNGNVSVSRVAISGAPVGSGYGLEIRTIGSASPGWGGFFFANMTAPSKVFLTRIVAKIPVGYTINWGSNAFGGGTIDWLTSQAGTGNWAEYICQVNVGTDGNYSSTNFFYLLGGTTPSSSNPLIWYVAYATVHDTTQWGTSNNIIVTATDSSSGIVGYGINQSSTTAPTFTSVSAINDFATLISNITANGTYYVWLKDASGNMAKRVVTVNYVDRTAPTLTISGSNPVYTTIGSTYSDAGAIASDNADTGIASRIQTTSTVNTNVAGTYTMTYNVSDLAGNAAATVSRQVVVSGLTQYRYRTASTYQSCSTCYDTCYRYATGTASYSCSSGTLSGTQCKSPYGISSTFHVSYICSGGSWAWNGQTCSGNCSAPCPDGSSPGGHQTGGSCPPSGSCTSGSTSCNNYWSGTCYSYSSATVTYTCPSGYSGGGSSSSCSQSYSCNPYSCYCTPYTTWSGWSSWSTTAVSSSSTVEVETRTCTSWPCSSS